METNIPIGTYNRVSTDPLGNGQYKLIGRDRLAINKHSLRSDNTEILNTHTVTGNYFEVGTETFLITERIENTEYWLLTGHWKDGIINTTPVGGRVPIAIVSHGLQIGKFLNLNELSASPTEESTLMWGDGNGVFWGDR